MKRGFLLCCAVLIMSLYVQAKAEIYKWTDDRGVVHFTDEMPSQDEADVESMPSYQKRKGVESEPDTSSEQTEETIESGDSYAPSIAESAKDDLAESEGYGPAEVELYTTDWCGYCKKAIEFLESKGVPFREYDVDKDKEAAKRKSALGGGSGVPFAIINGKKIYGFSEELYENALSQ